MGKIYVIGSQKGGVGKATSILNLAYALRKQGKKVLAVDFDSQANLTACYGIENIRELENTIGYLMMAAIEDEKLPAMKKCIRTKDGVDFIPSSIYLSVADAKLRLEMGAEKILSEILDPLREKSDYILIDTCPLLGMLTINALAVADEVIITVNTQLLAMMGLQDYLRTVTKIRRRINPKLTFRMYEGERLEDMVQSIREHGVLNPVIVRKQEDGYEMLSGHNWQRAAMLAGIDKIPAIVKENLSDKDAIVYVIETNMIQRSFSELLPSEKAAVLAVQYEKISSQGKRNDILQEITALNGQDGTCGHDGHKSRSRDELGNEYGMTGRNIARYMRVDKLIPEFKEELDNGALSLVAAVDLSYLSEKEQKVVAAAASENKVKLSSKNVEMVYDLRYMHKLYKKALD